MSYQSKMINNIICFIEPFYRSIFSLNFKYNFSPNRLYRLLEKPSNTFSMLPSVSIKTKYTVSIVLDYIPINKGHYIGYCGEKERPTLAHYFLWKVTYCTRCGSVPFLKIE